MSDGLRPWLRSIEPDGAPGLEAVLVRLVAASFAAAKFAGAETLRTRAVYRLRFDGERPPGRAGASHSWIVKRLSLDRSHREQRATRVWLPRVGLGALAPPLLEVAATPRGDRLWHVYADLGEATLERLASGPGREERLRAVVERIAALHLRFVGHPLLADCRLAGLELGSGFFAASLDDAVRGLTALRRLAELPLERRPLLERLLERLLALSAERGPRALAYAELDWPETLQHGDLWLSNVLLTGEPARPCVRLIDWERAGVGVAIYDLSTLLRQLPPHDRAWILDAYREHVEPAGWRWPEPARLEAVAESCELGRFASCLLWRTLSVLEAHRDGEPLPDWLFADLAEMERWFVERTPLLPKAEEASAA